MPPVIPHMSDHYSSPPGWGLMGSGALLGLIVESEWTGEGSFGDMPENVSGRDL